MITPEQLKSIRSQWTRQQGRLANVVVELDKEIDKMKEKKLPPAFIQQKSYQLDTIIKTNNQADDLIRLILLENAELKTNVAIMTKRYLDSLDDSIKELTFITSSNLNSLKKESELLTNEIKQK